MYCGQLDFSTTTTGSQITNGQYCLVIKSCHFDAQYNTLHFPKQKNKWRLGVVYKNGRAQYGNDTDYNKFESIEPKMYHYGCGHSWTETKDGDVIDWFINYDQKKPVEEKAVWTKAELAELGYEYKYYTNEDAIRRKTQRDLSKCNKKKNPTEKCCCEYNYDYWKRDRLDKTFDFTRNIRKEW